MSNLLTWTDVLLIAEAFEDFWGEGVFACLQVANPGLSLGFAFGIVCGVDVGGKVSNGTGDVVGEGAGQSPAIEVASILRFQGDGLLAGEKNFGRLVVGGTEPAEAIPGLGINLQAGIPLFCGGEPADGFVHFATSGKLLTIDDQVGSGGTGTAGGLAGGEGLQSKGSVDQIGIQPVAAPLQQLIKIEIIERPQLDAAIVSARGQGLAIATPTHAPDTALLGVEGRNRAAIAVPQLDAAI